MKNIELNNIDYTISDETYKRIFEIVINQKICSECGLSYTKENPEVVSNVCYNDVLKRSNNALKLVKIEKEQLTEGKTCIVYIFKDTEGKISYGSPDFSSSELRSNTRKTLAYYGFTFPIQLYSTNDLWREWHIKGNPATDDLLIIKNSYSTYSDKKGFQDVPVEYITFKNGTYIELNKRKKVIRDAYKKSNLEATAKNEWYKDAYVIKYLPKNINEY